MVECNVSLKDKVCIVTGSTRGIGKAIAAAFAEHGARVVVNFHSKADYAWQSDDRTILLKADVSHEDEVVNLVRLTKMRFGTVDVLVNNAGIHKDSVTWKMDKADWDEVVSTNLTGAFLCTKHVLPIMREKSWGRIINISSVTGEVGLFGASNYSASKSALFGLTKSVAREVANRNITVNCVAFGYIEEGMNLRLPREYREQALQKIPLGRFGKIEEAVAPILFLCSNQAAYITGQVIHVNGGYYM
jgi:3-oxoacyl-[acyl-carrier protein] reductase